MSTPNSEAPAAANGSGLLGQLRFASGANLKADSASRAKALATRRARIAAGREKYLPRADDAHWVQLAARRGFRMPEAWVASTPQKLRQWAKRVLPPADSDEPGHFPPRAWGFRAWSDAITANPAWSLRAFVGLMLEEAANVGR